MQATSEKRALLGKRVRVTIDRPEHGPARIVEGKLLGFGDDGTFEVMQDDGFVHYCWPMLDIEEAGGPKPSKVSAHFNFADYWAGIIFRPGHAYIAPLPCFIIHVRWHR